MSRRRGVAALVVALLLPGLAMADPALFRVTGGGAPVFLFGSMHLLPPRTEWRTQAFDDAVASTRAECFELPEAPNVTMLFQLGAALDLAYPLHKDLTKVQFAAVRRQARAAGLPMTVIDHMRPWLAALTFVSLAQAQDRTLKPPGVDTQMMAAARTRNVPVCGMETLPGFVALLNDVPRADQVRMLDEVLTPHAGAGEAGATLDVFESWRSGDLARLDAIADRSRQQAPALFDALLRRRNEAWLPHIEAILHGDTPTIVTVGALHLPGPDGLLALLERRGYHLERIQ